MSTRVIAIQARGQRVHAARRLSANTVHNARRCRESLASAAAGLGAVGLALLAIVAIAALLIAEYALLWAVLVAPWLDALPPFLPYQGLPHTYWR
jgi:hypothetical protein